jgi:hypothetical protein
MLTVKQEELNKQISTVEYSINNLYQRPDDFEAVTSPRYHTSKEVLNVIYTHLDIILKIQVSFINWDQLEKDLGNTNFETIIRDELVVFSASIDEMISVFKSLDDKNVSYIINHLKQLERYNGNCIFELSQFILTRIERNVKSEVVAFKSLKKKAILEIEDVNQIILEESINKIRNTSTKLSINLDQSVQEFYMNFSERKIEFSSVFNESIDKLSKSKDDGQLTLSKLVKEQQSWILESSAEEAAKFQRHVADIEGHISDDINQTIERELELSQDKIDVHIDDFRNMNVEIHNLLGVAGSDVLANNHLKQADNEKKVADILRLIGFIVLALATVFACFEINRFVDEINDISMKFVIVRLLIVFLLTTPGIYILKESSRHRSDERKYREVGIQLATINSYLDSFSSDEKSQIKRNLTTNFFGSKQADVDTSSVPDMQKIVEKLVDTVGSMTQVKK